MGPLRNQRNEPRVTFIKNISRLCQRGIVCVALWVYFSMLHVSHALPRIYGVDASSPVGRISTSVAVWTSEITKWLVTGVVGGPMLGNGNGKPIMFGLHGKTKCDGGAGSGGEESGRTTRSGPVGSWAGRRKCPTLTPAPRYNPIPGSTAGWRDIWKP